ncbi:MAG: phosphohexose mutase [Meiothermus sp.]
MAIKFGTDGWRAVIGEEYTFKNVGRVAQAYAAYLQEQGAKKVVVGYDTRFMAGKFAEHAARVLAANGLETHLSKSYLPTPALSYAVKHLGADGGVMITASHNPPEYLGFKIKGGYGGAATPAMIAEVEGKLGAEVRAESNAKIHSFDIRKPYYEFLMSHLDLAALKTYDGVLYHDSMGGSGAGWLAGFVKQAGLGLELRELHAVPDPTFYGVNPEPIPANQFTVMTVLKAEEGPTFAAVTDGDADRIGAVLAGGANFDSHQIFAVLLKHLYRKGLTGKVVKTISVSRVVELLANKWALEVQTTPIGFKYITDEMLGGGVLIGGEESGGIGVAGHLPERDGVYNALLLLESVVTSGKSLAEQFAELEAEVGFRHFYDRLDLHLPSMGHIGEVMAKVAIPQTLAGQTVTHVETLDGIKWNFTDGGWLLFRPSGTEPVLRVYAEVQDQKTLKSLLKEARALVGG